ncbi:active regulator of SIRT1-like [Saccoglossus kowalevskii]|uniref:Active regulator of SIRT1 n=1 Tax=Saccoglossus kowalevskii TaxID=10224 RepID=A0ABM0GUA3_SACKO|nr:PREDICTED: active regulator of SIRT1-like [Saccoglossus kowalevskii]
MSAALVRKGLELFKDDIKPECSNESERRKKKRSGSKKMELPSTNKKGVKKQRMKLLGTESKKPMSTVKDKKIKSAIESYLSRGTEDNSETNLQYMLENRTKLRKEETYMTILTHHRGRLSKDRVVAETEEEDTTIFDESDFEKFEKEYKTLKHAWRR